MYKIKSTLIVLLTSGGFAIAQAPEQRGLKIAELIDSKDTGWVNQVSDVEMKLKNQYGQESNRQMKIKILEDTDKSDDLGDKSLTTFRTPKDVKGTSFLSFSRNNGADDQWLYIPALRRVKQIASDNKSGPFMGSEFAFEDIAAQDVEKYSYKFIKEEQVGGAPGFVIERYPVAKNSGYTKQVVWVDSKEYRIYKIEYYDRKGAMLKTLTYEGYKAYEGNTWRASKMNMVNHQNGKSTLLHWKSFAFKANINQRDFDKNALKRLK